MHTCKIKGSLLSRARKAGKPTSALRSPAPHLSNVTTSLFWLCRQRDHSNGPQQTVLPVRSGSLWEHSVTEFTPHTGVLSQKPVCLSVLLTHCGAKHGAPCGRGQRERTGSSAKSVQACQTPAPRTAGACSSLSSADWTSCVCGLSSDLLITSFTLLLAPFVAFSHRVPPFPHL